jgi:hypothetical protein
MNFSSLRILHVIAVVLCMAALPINLVSAEPSNAQKLKLKATVVKHIKQHTAEGTYFFVNSENTSLTKLKFVAMHPVVFERSDGAYALCADFENEEKEKVLVDYYLMELNGDIVLLSSIEGKRSILMKLAQKFGI